MQRCKVRDDLLHRAIQVTIVALYAAVQSERFKFVSSLWYSPVALYAAVQSESSIWDAADSHRYVALYAAVQSESAFFAA